MPNAGKTAESSVWIVVPAFNETKTIGRVLSGLFQHGFTNVVVVNDGSSDDTAEAAQQLGAVVVNHPYNCGQGAALETGNRYACQQRAAVVVHFDADGQLDPADIAPAIAELQSNNLDMVLGSRFLGNTTSMPWFKRRVLLPVARLINWMLTGVWLTDAHNGFRVLAGRALTDLRITQDRMAHNSQIVRQIKKLGLRYAERPVAVSYTEYGQSAAGGVVILKDWFVGSFIED